MAQKKELEAGAESGFRIFKKPGAPGTKERIAINLATGFAVETDGPGKYYIHLTNGKHAVLSDESLEILAGLPEQEDDLRA